LALLVDIKINLKGDLNEIENEFCLKSIHQELDFKTLYKYPIEYLKLFEILLNDKRINICNIKKMLIF
jgi:hypothetical protein